MTLSPKHLSFTEMWQLYKQIKPGLPENQKDKLFDEVIEILKAIPHQNFVQSLVLMFGKDFSKGKNAAEYGLLFVQGIKKNKFFLFTDFIKSIQK